jgi:phosphatidate cytidylyltransferase
MNQNLKLRIITALIGVPVILGLLIGLGVEGVAFFSWVVSMGMMIEFTKMFFTLPDAFYKTVLMLTLTTIVHFMNYWLMVGVSSAFLGIIPVILLSVLFLLMVPKLFNYGGAVTLNSPEGIEKLSKHFSELMAACFGFAYACWLPLLMVSIRQADQGKYWLVFTMLVVWSSDTFAYFSGKYFGKTLLYETVSPKKTWAGAIGGSLGALLVSVCFAHFFLPDVSVIEISVISLTISVASIFGDLCESLMKRAANVKDSGSILPGHGGFLDRFDGVVFALPVMYAFLWLLHS